VSGSIFLNRNQAALVQITTPEMAETGMQQGKGQEADVGWTCEDFMRFLEILFGQYRKSMKIWHVKNGRSWDEFGILYGNGVILYGTVSATFSAKFS
jgi:hypothetical protein